MTKRPDSLRILLPLLATLGAGANLGFGIALVAAGWAVPSAGMIGATLGLGLAAWMTFHRLPAANAGWAAATLIGTAIPAAGLTHPAHALLLALTTLGLALALGRRLARREHAAGWALLALALGMAWGPPLLAGGASPGLDVGALLHGSWSLAVGQRGGVLPCAPLAACLLLASRRRGRWLAVACVTATVALCGQRLLGAPPVLGGGSAWLLGPLLLWAEADGETPSRRTLALAWAWCAVVSLSGILSVIGSHGRPDRVPVLDRGVFALLPYEATVVAAPGEVEETWAGETLRYLEAPAEVGPGRLTLTPGQPRARLLLATPGAEWPVRLLIESNLPALTLVHRDWATTKRYPLVGAANGTRTLLTLELAPGWRLHPLPTDGAAPQAADQALRRFDLGLEMPAGANLPVDARVAIRHPRGTATLAAAFAASAPGFVLPTTAEAGSASWVEVPLRNDGRFVWDPDVRPGVILSYRLIPPPVGVRSAVDGTRSRLPAPVPLGASVTQPLRIRWPDAPGRYWLVVDLALERLMWFEDAAGAPLVAGWVEVLPRRAGRTSS